METVSAAQLGKLVFPATLCEKVLQNALPWLNNAAVVLALGQMHFELKAQATLSRTKVTHLAS